MTAILTSLEQTTVALRDSLSANSRRFRDRQSLYSLADYTRIKDDLNSKKEFIVAKAGAIMGDLDTEQFVNTTRALSLKKPSHVAFEETGVIGGSNSQFNYSPTEVLEVINLYRRFSRGSIPNYKMSIPRGKGTGFPTASPGSDRVLSNASLVAIVDSQTRFRTHDGVRLKDYIEVLCSRVHGLPVMSYAERSQHTDKGVPCHLSDGYIAKSDVEYRVRGIYISPKPHVLWNRRAVKTLMYRFIMANPLHEPDKKRIHERVMKAMRQKWFVAALDQSKFDQGHGAPRIWSVLDVISGLMGPAVAADFKEEITVPLWYPTISSSASISSSTPILPSGISWTTVAGCIGSILALNAVIKRLGYTWDQRGENWDALVWGDDVLFMSRKSHSEAEIGACYEQIKLKVTFEPNVKYLGFVYDKDYMSYSRYRLFQGLFPERTSDPMLYKMGLVSKIAMYGFPDKVAAIDAFVACNNEIKTAENHVTAAELVKPFHSNVYIKEGIERANKVGAAMSALDEIINRFSVVFDESEAYALLGISPDEGPWISIDQARKELPPELMDEIRKDPFNLIVRLSGPDRMSINHVLPRDFNDE